MAAAQVKKIELKEYRCNSCGKVIAKADLKPCSTIQIKCKCKTFNTIEVPQSAN